MSENINGVTYYGLTSEYEGDVTKGCGLTAAEIDGNFYFLRGKEIVSLDWSDEENLFTIKLLNGDVIKSDSVTGYIDRTIEEALSGITEDIEALKCQVSGLSESIEGVYDEIDVKIAEFREEFGIFKRNLEEEMNEKDEQIVADYNSKIDELAHVVALLTQRVENDEVRISALESGVTVDIDNIRTELQSEIDANTQAINNLSAATESSINQTSEELDAKINAQGCIITGLQEENEVLSGRMDSLEVQIGEVARETQVAINNQNIVITETINNIGRLSADTYNSISVINGLIESGSQKFDEFSACTATFVESINDRMDTVNENIATINDRMDTIDGNITSINGRMDDMDATISQLSADTNNALREVNEKIDNEISALSAATSEAIDTLSDNMSSEIQGIKDTIGDTSEMSGATIIEYINEVVAESASGISQNLKFTGNDVEE